jgi:hypothetical protein
MRQSCQRLLAILAIGATSWLLLVTGYAAPTAKPNATSPEAKAEQAEQARIKASEALADSLLPRIPGTVPLADQSDPANGGAETENPVTDPNAPAQTPEIRASLKAKAIPVANLFRVPGPAVILQARAAGYHFSPAGGSGLRNGIHTIAQQHPNTITSEVDGVALRQFRSPPGWAMPTISNTFYMFVQSNLTPAPLAPGWKIRGIHLKGTNWKWVDGPQSGAPSASFAIAITAGKFGPLASEVILEGLTLEGPPGETNWRMAFAPSSVAQR